MQPAECADRQWVPQHPAQHAIASIFARSQSVAVLDSPAPAGDRPLPYADMILYSYIPSQHVTAPTVMIARDQQHGCAGLAQIGERRKNAETGAGNHRSPFEPELEEVAVDYERSTAALQMT